MGTWENDCWGGPKLVLGGGGAGNTGIGWNGDCGEAAGAACWERGSEGISDSIGLTTVSGCWPAAGCEY